MLADGLRSKNIQLREHFVSVAKLEPFIGTGKEIAREFVKDGQNLDDLDSFTWHRYEEYDVLANEMVEIHSGLLKALGGGGEAHKDCVQHLEHGVYAQ